METSLPSDSQPGPTPEVFSTLTLYGAIDWGRGKNDLCIVDRNGTIIWEQSIDNSPEVWADLRAKLAAMKAPDGLPAVVGFAIETNCGRADRSRVKAPWADAYYWQKRKQGMRHAAALRCLAMRWLKILWKMWTEGSNYDGDRHLRDQLKHGSWVIALMPQQAVQSN